MDKDHLIWPELPWRKYETAYEKAFPHQQQTIIAVLDAPTPEAAQIAADRLAQRLNGLSDWIRAAQNIRGSAFFRRNGLLFLSEDELSKTLAAYQRAEPLLSQLASDGSLRGVMGSIGLSLRGVQFHRITLEALAPQFAAFAKPVKEALGGGHPSFSWQRLLESGAARPSTRQLITIIPILNYAALEPGASATGAVRRAVAELGLAEEGVQVRLTGPVPLADEEFATLEQGVVASSLITIALVQLILWLALHSTRIIAAVFITVAFGLVITAAAGLALAGALNPISIAFFVLFVGIGVDFGLQFSVSYRAARYECGDFLRALEITAAKNGGRLTLAALATAAGFLSFVPTAYIGVAELGEIAGAGMIIALVLSITLLPALLRIFNAPPERLPLGYDFLVPVDAFLERHRIAIVAGTVGIALCASPLLYWLQFDANLMNLRNPRLESVAAYFSLRKDPETSGQTAEILAPSLDAANRLAEKLAVLPEVARAITISAFIPGGQDAKLSEIKAASDHLRSTLNPTDAKAAPSDAEIVESLQATAARLTAAASRDGRGAAAANELASALVQLARAEPKVRTEVSKAFVTPLEITLDGIRQSLDPQPITLDALPPQITRDWLTSKGGARVSVAPNGDTDNNEVRRRFVDAVLAVAPNATGQTVVIQKAAETVILSFVEAAVYALISIAILLWLFLRRFSDVVLTLFPLILAALVTLEICSGIGFKLNFANIIALPVLLGLGVAFKIYYIVAWRQGQSNLLSSPLTRAVFFSGLTTAVAFGSLWLSDHPGMSSMGELLALSLACTMAAAILFQPLLMGRPQRTAIKGPAAEMLRPRQLSGTTSSGLRT
jgi:hopanoid biosynthesis associated RND transporter like protein HpnN